MSTGKLQKAKKIPMRRCTGCGESFEKKSLIRVVRSPEGTVSLDFTGKKSGRGVYVCPKATCFKKARKAGRFRQNLECEIPDEIYTTLEAEIAALEKERSAKGE